MSVTVGLFWKFSLWWSLRVIKEWSLISSRCKASLFFVLQNLFSFFVYFIFDFCIYLFILRKNTHTHTQRERERERDREREREREREDLSIYLSIYLYLYILTRAFKRFLRILLKLFHSRFCLIISGQKFRCKSQGMGVEKELFRTQWGTQTKIGGV